MSAGDSDAGSISRRGFLKAGAALATGVSLGAPFQALAQSGGVRARSPGYGPLLPVADLATGLPLLKLPRRFRYSSMSWRGDPMLDGAPIPALHDGGAALQGRGGRVYYVRNQEQFFIPGLGLDTSFASPQLTYDGGEAPGGTTTLIFDPDSGEYLGTFPSLSGTIRNCAGGPTPWNTWLSCEETLDEPGSALFGASLAETHGWVFEVRVRGRRTRPIPIRGLGRFVHEAVAVDPWTGIVYETEDRGSSGIYRFVPYRYGRLHRGGRLEMLKLQGLPAFDTSAGLADGSTFQVEWVPIADPESDPFSQGLERGGAIFKRGEGIWYGHGRIYFSCTTAGAAAKGQIWELDPWQDRLKMLFESPGAEVLDNPDNVTVSPRGGIVLCEDGGGDTQFLRGLTPTGEIFDFAQNNVVLEVDHNELFRAGDYSNSEFAGACFTPDGRWLFVSVQLLGVTFAITGPWHRGAL